MRYILSGKGEKTEQVLAAADGATSEEPPAPASEDAVDVATLATASDAQGSKCKGHGRKAATDYDGAETVEIFTLVSHSRSKSAACVSVSLTSLRTSRVPRGART